MDNDQRGLDDAVRLDSAKLQALAHPLRSRLLATLRAGGPATATGLAARLGTNSGATSYHLRKLLDVGLVAEMPGKGTTRERWWQAAHRHTTWTETDFDDNPDDRAAAEWLLGHYVRNTSGLVQEWLESRTEWSTEWRDAADHSDYLLSLTPDGLVALRDELHEVIARHLARSDAHSASAPEHDDDDGDGAVQQVMVVLHGFPTASEQTPT